MTKQFVSLSLAIFLLTCGAGSAATKRYISIGSGGMLGVGVAEILRDIEEQTGRAIHKQVDGICGTSTGALIASLLSVKAEGREAPYKAEEVIEFYKTRGAPIFMAARAAVMNALFGEADYSESSLALKTHTEEVFGESKLSDAVIDLMVLSHDRTKNKNVLFDSKTAKADPMHDIRLSDAARASSTVYAAFGILKLNLPLGAGEFIDAGSMGLRPQVNDPVNELIERLLPTLGDDDNIVVYALGTGFGHPPALAHASDKIEVVRIQPSVRHLVGLFGMDFLASDTSSKTVDNVIAAAKAIKETPNYQRMLNDLKADREL